jgi:hypothetical protein
LPLIFQNVFKGGFSFLRNALKVAPVPYLVVAGFGFWLGSLVHARSTRKPFQSLLNILIIILVFLLITFANMVPIKIARLPTSWPGARSFFPSQFSLVSGVFLIGWQLFNFIGSIKYRIVETYPARVLQTIAGLALLAYGIHALPQAADKLELYRLRAQAWDMREQILFTELKAGQKEVVIPQFESVYNITELKPEADSWVNVCAARYYGADSISAQEDYMGIGTFPIGK